MGFSVEYSGLVLTHLLYNTALILSSLKSFFSWVTRSIGQDPSSTCVGPSAQLIRSRLEVMSYDELPHGSCDDATCAVCLNELQKGDTVRELRNCCHVFHVGCIDRWLDHGDHKNCPLCRAPLYVASGCGSDLTRSEPSWVVERLLYLFGDDLL